MTTDNALADALELLRDSVLEGDEPIYLPDAELAELAELAAEELRRRLPRYALNAGDLEESDADEVDRREAFAELAAENALVYRRQLAS